MQDELGLLYDYDELKFRNSAARDLDSMQSHSQTVARLIYAEHALEKSLSNDNFQYGRGLDNIKLLVHLIEVYNRREYDTTHLAYISALSALKEFHRLHKGTEFLSIIQDIYGDFFEEITNSSSDIGGAEAIPASSKKKNKQKNFKDLASSRASVRTYSDKPVELSLIREALSIAMQTPTVCNRQAIQVRLIRDKQITAKVLEIQGGIIGYETPPAVLLITADDTAYLGANERNQGFIDGGLYAMSALYALEYVGLAACALNAAFTESKEKVMREIMNIPDSEKFITFISVGHFKESNNICKSFRYSVDDILTEVNEIYKSTPSPIELEEVRPSFIDRVRRRARLRTRIKNAVSALRRTTRVRTRLRSIKSYLKLKIRFNKFYGSSGAIVTLIDYNNYGNILQRYALQDFLLKKGYAFISLEHNLPIVNNLNDKRLLYTASFVKRNIFTKPVSAGKKYTKYIVGSDQVWRDFSYENIKEQLGFFFLNFTQNRNVLRISYAASFGRNSLEEAKISAEVSRYIKPLIKKFDAVSVRERAATTILEDAWGVNSEVVLDPTMLLETKDYARLIQESPLRTEPVDGVFAYLIGVTEENEQLLKKAVVYINKGLLRIDLADYSGPLPPVEQWLRGLKEADLAVVDSFHGAVFSIINNTDFVVLENKGSGMERMVNLLDVFGIKKRIIRHSDVDTFSFDDLPPINWDEVNSKLSELRKKSAGWLIAAIESPKKP